MIIEDSFAPNYRRTYSKKITCCCCKITFRAESLRDVEGCCANTYILRCPVCQWINAVDVSDEEVRNYYVTKFEDAADEKGSKVLLSIFGIIVFLILLFFSCMYWWSML